MKSISLSAVIMVLITACAVTKNKAALIQDCPEEKIVDKMPGIIDKDNPAPPNAYYLYKGQRREISEFDQQWLEKKCQIKESVVH